MLVVEKEEERQRHEVVNPIVSNAEKELDGGVPFVHIGGVELTG